MIIEGGTYMTTDLYKKGIVLGIICLFIGAGVVPSISGNNDNGYSLEENRMKYFSHLSEKKWNKSFLDSDFQGFYHVEQTNDGGYIATGFSDGSFPYAGGDVLLIKTNQDGNQLWSKTFGGSFDDFGICVKQTNDIGYIIVGYGKNDAYLIKTDSEGNMIWDNHFGGNNYDWGEVVLQSDDNGYIFTGHTSSYGSGDYDVWLVKTDSNGNKLWDKTFGGSEIDGSRSVIQSNDGGYIIIGYTKSYGSETDDTWLIKTDSNGNELWNKTFGDDENDDRGRSVYQTNDGGYIITGMIYITEQEDWDFYLVKTDSEGNMEWDNNYGGVNHEPGRSVLQTNDGGYIIIGETSSFGSGLEDLWLIKTDSFGNVLWDKTFGGSNYDTGYVIRNTNDGGYILTGWTASYGEDDADAWLIKTDYNGNELWNKTYTGIEIYNNINIEIKGGFRISAVIKNDGTATVTDVEWSIDLDGGLIFAGEHTEGVISELAPGATETIRQTILYGIGRTTITVTAGDAEKQATGFILGPLVLNVQEI